MADARSADLSGPGLLRKSSLRLRVLTGRGGSSSEVAAPPGPVSTFSSLRSAASVEARRVAAAARPVTGVITGLGWLVIGLGLSSWVAGAILGWSELLLAAATCILAALISAAFVVGNSTLDVKVELDPPRVVTGEPVAGRVAFNNPSKRRTAAREIELPIGRGLAHFGVPSLAPGDGGEEIFIVSTERRGVIPVGPPTSVKGDPLGLMVRKAPGGERLELMVHPKTIGIPPFGSGLLRDLEGLTTKEVSPSDLAFHSLRDYAFGDDRRFIHWRSSARTGKLQVRQFLDTRRSALTVVVDSRPGSYADEDEFEVALQVAGSLALRAVKDGLPALIIAGEHAATSAVPHSLLDALSRVELEAGAPDLSEAATRATRHSSDTTMAVLLGGSKAQHHDVQRAGLRFAPEVRIFDMRIRPSQESSLATNGRTTLVHIRSLRDLPLIIAKGDSW